MRTIFTIAAVAALSGCVLDDLGSGASRSRVVEARSTDELIEMGAVRLDGPTIEATLAGLRLVEPNEGWVWDINADGTQHARDQSNAWADAPGGTWDVEGDRFCRQNEDIQRRCSDVYKIGSYYRFTEDDGALSVWTVTPG